MYIIGITLKTTYQFYEARLRAKMPSPMLFSAHSLMGSTPPFDGDMTIPKVKHKTIICPGSHSLQLVKAKCGLDPSTSEAQTFAHISFCPPLPRRACRSNDDARNVTCSTLRRLSAEGPDAPGDGLNSFQAPERTLTGESDHDPVWPHGYQRSGDLEDISFHSQEPKLSPACSTSLCTCAALQSPK